MIKEEAPFLINAAAQHLAQSINSYIIFSLFQERVDIVLPYSLPQFKNRVNLL